MEVTFTGHECFRYRVVLSVITKRPLVINMDRKEGQRTLRPYEESFMKVIHGISNGSHTASAGVFRFTPGSIGTPTGNKFSVHPSRTIAWYIEPLLLMLPFASGESLGVRAQSWLTMHGTTCNGMDLSVDLLRHTAIPLMKSVLGEDFLGKMTITQDTRSYRPPGYTPESYKKEQPGKVTLNVPVVPQLSPLTLLTVGQVGRVIGTAWGTGKANPGLVSAAGSAAQGYMKRMLGNVDVATDVHRDNTAPAFGCVLLSQSKEGVTMAAEATLNDDTTHPDINEDGTAQPATVGERAALRLVHVITHGGCITPQLVPLTLCLMALTPSQATSTIRVGPLSPTDRAVIEVIKTMLHVTFLEEAGGVGTVRLTTRGGYDANMQRQAM